MTTPSIHVPSILCFKSGGRAGVQVIEELDDGNVDIKNATEVPFVNVDQKSPCEGLGFPIPKGRGSLFPICVNDL